MASESSPSVNHIPGLVVYDPTLSVSRYVTGSVLTNSTPIDAKIVDGDGTQITSFGGGTQYAVDTALGATPTGTLAVAIRDDALSALTPVEGDAIGLRVDANGALWVIPSGTTVVSATDLDIRNLVAATDIVTVTGGAGQTADVKITLDSESVAITNGGLTELAATIFTEDTVLTTPDVLMVGAREDNSGGARALVVHQNSGGLLISGDQDHDASDAGFPLKIGGYAKAAAPTNVSLDGDRVNAWFLLNGAQAVNITAAGALIPGDATNGLTVDLGTNNDVVGTVADDSTTPGNPVMVGGFAVSIDGTTPGAVAEADVARFRTDLNRRLLVNDDHPQWLNYQENSSSALTDTAVFADPGDGFQIVVTSIIVSTGAATAMNFFLEEGVTTVFGPIYLEAVAGRGFVSGPIKKHITVSTALTITTSAAIAHSISIQGYIQAV